MTAIQPLPDSRLDQLVAQYDAAKAHADEAAAALKAITDGIKVELAIAAPNSTTVNLTSDYLARPLRLQAKETWRLDAKKLKAEIPETYVRYATKSTVWELRAVGATS